jgi:hypothetical protein
LRFGKFLQEGGELAEAVTWMDLGVVYEREAGLPEAEEHAQQVEGLRRAAGVDGPEPSA